MTTYVLATRDDLIIITLPQNPKASLALTAVVEKAAMAEEVPTHHDLLAELEALGLMGAEIDVVEGGALGEVDWLDIGAKPPAGFVAPDPMDQSDTFLSPPGVFPVAEGGLIRVRTDYDFDAGEKVGYLTYYGDGTVVKIDMDWKVTEVWRKNEDGSVSTHKPVYGAGKQSGEIVTWHSRHEKDGVLQETNEHHSDGRTIDTLYDSEGRITFRRTDDGDGTVTFEQFDTDGNVTSRKVIETEVDDDGKITVTTKTYDGDGKLVSEKTEVIERKDDDSMPVEPGADGGPSALSDTAKDMLDKAGSGPAPDEKEILTDPDAEAKGDLPDSADDTPGPDGALILVDPDIILFRFTELPDLDAFDPAYGRTQPDPTEAPDASEVEPPQPAEGTDFFEDTLIF